MKPPSTTPVESLARGDAIAGRLLEWLGPLRFAEAANQLERQAAYRLRYRAVVEENMSNATGLTGELESDVFDADAVQIVGWDGSEAIATCRLVFPSADRPLPMEETFGRAAPDGRPLVEWGRVTVDSRLRGQGARLFMGLAARGWLTMRARGQSTAIGVTPERLVRLFRALGFPVIVLGAPRMHWGVERVPILCEGTAAVHMLEHLWDSRDSGQRQGV